MPTAETTRAADEAVSSECARVVHVVMGLQRVEIVVLRWPGLRTFNAVATFSSLAAASATVQALDVPVAKSMLVCVRAQPRGALPQNEFVALQPMVGVHTDERVLRDRAMRTMRHHGPLALADFALKPAELVDEDR